ncbi:TPA: plasmid mobilization relaxosome protein MobC [Streptococcus agalactiae]|nr:plasmid mobilization relaxosome protein MobC [Streptococcus agalactiae]HEN7362283.1 plasmid mobilization relaxosome protein MobC [Streptococcus agalactiae]HEN7902737.1 plasmid mobilization relaxosome protein MobC [Streptococcus agalactiae]
MKGPYFMSDYSKRSREILKRFYITEDELKKIKLKMEQANMRNFSNYARLMLTRGRITVVDFEGLIEFKKEVNRIGVNINQIAKGVNLGDEVSVSTLELLLNEVKQIDSKVIELISQLEAKGD